MKQKNTYRQIIDKIIEMMVKGDLKPGDKLPGERTLAEELKASRASVREAFRTLEVMGLIEARHGGGTFIREFNISPFINSLSPLLVRDMDMMGEIMDFRIMIESEAVKAAAKAGDKNSIKKLRQALKLMKGDDFTTDEKADLLFHKLIFLAAGNRIMSIAGESLSYILYKSIHESREKFNKNPDIKNIWKKDHESILKAIERNDQKKAEEALVSHLEGVRKFMMGKE